jgi:CRISPR-associated protein (TIGR02584 family)
MNVLIALVGMTPAVVTETIWALANHALHERDRFKPDRIVIVTTGEGKIEVEDQLLATIGELKPPLTRLINRAGLDADCAREGKKLEILCPVADPEDGDLDEDAHAPDELDRMGDLIFATIRKYASDPQTRICVSLSGGRKTMSHLAGQCLSLLARPQDFLTHVVVKPASLERCDGFFFPEDVIFYPKPSHDDPNPMEVSPSEIDVRLTRVPFVRLTSIPDVNTAVDRWADQGFSSVVSGCNMMVGAAEPLRLVYRKSTGQVFLGDKNLEEAVDAKQEKCLHSAGIQIAALRMIGRCQGFATQPDEQDFRRYMQCWIEVSLARGEKVDSGKWWTKFTSAFFSSIPKVHPQVPDAGHVFIGSSYLKMSLKISSEVSHLRDAIGNTVQSLDKRINEIPKAERGGHYKLPPTLTFIEED